MEEKEVYCIMVEPNMIEAVWDKCVPFLSNPDIGDVEFSSVEQTKESCSKGTDQLWMLMTGDELVGCFNTNFGPVSPGISLVNIYNLSGMDIKSWIDILDHKISKFAKDNGCAFYMYIGRRGFSKLVPGLKEVGSAYIKDLRGFENE